MEEPPPAATETKTNLPSGCGSIIAAGPLEAMLML